tara:strand:+ start:23056 stop:23187 length:132 start_codon:yes stop_codon:yes gene_type:complete
MFRKVLFTLTIGSCALALTACNTVRGVGQDIESVATTTEEAIN